MSKGRLQFALAVAVLAALYFAFRKKECVSSTFTPDVSTAGQINL